MIKSLQLRDFQSHQDTLLEFSPGVNVITGASDSGKSACFRGLYWVMTNRPSGLGFIRKAVAKKKDGRAEVTVVVENAGKSTVITRTRSAKDNSCTCGKQAFSTLNKDVPEDVLKVMDMTEINIQRQLDGPFLILSSPGAVAQKFNQYTNLDKVDQMVSYLTSVIRESQQNKTYLEGDIDTVSTKMSKYAWLNEYSELVEIHEDLLVATDKLSADISAITASLAILTSFATRSQHNEVSLREAVAVRSAVDLVLQHVLRFDTVQKVNTAVSSFIAGIKRNAAGLEACETTGLREQRPLLETLTDVVTEVGLIEKDITALRAFVATITGLEAKLATNANMLQGSRAELAALNTQLLEFNTCPACGQALTPEAKQRLTEAQS